MDTIAAALSFLFLASLVAGVPCAIVGCLIGSLTKGRGGAGFWLGFFLGPLGWIIAALIADHRVIIKSRSLHSAPPVATGEAFCVGCGVDGVSTVEMGAVRWSCPSCGRAL